MVFHARQTPASYLVVVVKDLGMTRRVLSLHTPEVETLVLTSTTQN